MIGEPCLLLDVFKRDQPAQSLLVPLGDPTIGPAELLFGGAPTGMIFRCKLTFTTDCLWPHAGAPTIDFIATLPTVNLHLQRHRHP